MHTSLYKRSLLVAAFVLVSVTFIPITTTAQSERSEEARTEAQERKEIREATPETPRSQRGTEMRESNEERREVRETRLEAKKLRVCQNRERAIQNVMLRMADRSTKQLDVFTKIADRTQSFYEEKGNVAEGYSALLVDVAAKKASAQTVVAEIVSTSATFSCENDDPKGFVAGFKDVLQARNAALKEYKTAIKNLIVAVKSAQPTADDSNAEGVE